MLNRIIYILIVILIIIQFFGIDMHLPPSDEKLDFFAQVKATDEIENMVKTACYDCHSNKTEYPKYAYVQPIGWIIQSHIDDGRKHLNFSDWGKYDKKKKDHKLEECVEYTENKEMPLKGYTLLHPSANLDDTERKTLINFFNSLR